MLAVFWDDADLTLGEGKLFYQVRFQGLGVSLGQSGVKVGMTVIGLISSNLNDVSLS